MRSGSLGDERRLHFGAERARSMTYKVQKQGTLYESMKGSNLMAIEESIAELNEDQNREL